jgi:hypothetical protein
VGRREALLPEGADGEGVVALVEADAVFVGEELGVEVGGRGKAQEVAAADYFGDFGVDSGIGAGGRT